MIRITLMEGKDAYRNGAPPRGVFRPPVYLMRKVNLNMSAAGLRSQNTSNTFY